MPAKRNRTIKQVLRICQILFLVLFFCCKSFCVKAQAVAVTSAVPKTDKSVPSWIAMMDDPNVNYHDAVKAFEKYWKHRIKPVEEDELDESTEKTREQKREEKERKNLKPNDPAIKYAFEYKKFMHWKYEMADHVQEDGHIKGMDDRIKEWETQKRAKHDQEQKNKSRKNLPDSTRHKN
ncbi:MAG: hypothetical protein V4450_14720 [Bacteroidota bacterium]